MSYCNPATAMRTLPTCTQTLTIGTTATISGTLYVYLKNHTTNYIHRFEGTTNGSGVLTVNLKDPDANSVTQFIPTPKHDYSLWATTVGATNFEEKIDITINAIIYNDLGISFERIHTDEETLATYSAQTLKAA